MRGAFVIRLAPETLPAQGQFEGWVEEVDSGMELRFRSTGELLRFLAQRFDATFDFSEDASNGGQIEPASSGKERPG
jgi:hypothetical protein